MRSKQTAILGSNRGHNTAWSRGHGETFNPIWSNRMLVPTRYSGHIHSIVSPCLGLSSVRNHDDNQPRSNIPCHPPSQDIQPRWVPCCGRCNDREGSMGRRRVRRSTHGWEWYTAIRTHDPEFRSWKSRSDNPRRWIDGWNKATLDQEMSLERTTKGWTVGEEDKVVPMESITLITGSPPQGPLMAGTPIDERVDWGEDKLWWQNPGSEFHRWLAVRQIDMTAMDRTLVWYVFPISILLISQYIFFWWGGCKLCNYSRTVGKYVQYMYSI